MIELREKLGNGIHFSPAVNLNQSLASNPSVTVQCDHNLPKTRTRD